MDFDNYKKIKQLEVQHEADTLALKEADEIIAELVAKNMKMRNCSNCKNYDTCFQLIDDFDPFDGICAGWELEQ